MILIPPGSDAHKILMENQLAFFQEFEIIWEAAEHPQFFFFPFIMVTLHVRIENPQGDREVMQPKIRSRGGMKFSEIFVDACENFLHPTMRGFVEKPLFMKHTSIITSPEFLAR